MKRLFYVFVSIAIGLVITVNSLTAQNRNEWSVYSALTAAQSVAFDQQGKLWVATTGGVFQYDPITREYATYRTTEGLLTLFAASIGFDPVSGDMYVGSDNGAISIRRANGEWGYTTAIASETERADRRILGFRFHNNRTYILTAFGVAVFNPNDSTITDSYLRLGSIPGSTPVNDLLFWNGRIWLATDRGLVSAPETGVNLAAPDAWEVYSSGTICSERIISLIVLNNTLVVGTEDGACMWQGDGAFVKRDDLPFGTVRFAQNGSAIGATTENRVYTYATGRFDELTIRNGVLITNTTISPNGQMATSFAKSGFGIVEGDTLAVNVPNSPVSNYFAGLAADADGGVWAASSIRGAGEGLSWLRNDEWTTFTEAKTEGVHSNGVWIISGGANNTIWASTWGGGVSVFDVLGDDVHITNYGSSNSPLRGIDGAQSYVLTGAAVVDTRNRTWLTNFDNTPGRGPVLIAELFSGESSPDGSSFIGFVAPFANLTRSYPWLAVDQNGTKWLGADFSVSYSGLLYFNDGGTISNLQDDKWGLMTTSTGLPSNQQTALAVDPDGELWIGTPSGLVVLVNPGGVVNSNQAPIYRTIRALADVPIRTIAVDALNRKWVGTNNGLYLLSIDGSEVLEHYTTMNSPLVNDQVISVLTVEKTGDIFIGTVNGLNKISSDAKRPEPVDQLAVSPSPFILPTNAPLRIEGLPSNAVIKILTLSGALVFEFEAPGGAVAFWDGTDRQGNPVPSGIYIIAANSQLEDTTVLGKVAVVHQ